MFFADEIRLIGKTYHKNAAGQYVPEETARPVFCDLSSVSAAEYDSAGHRGLQPSARAQVMRAEYQGETELEYDGGDLLPAGRYKVYRSYLTPDIAELYLEARTGVRA